MLTLTQGHLNIKNKIMVFSEITGFGNYCSLRPETLQMQTTCEVNKKVQVGKDQEKAQSERDSHSKNRGGKKTKLTVRHLYHETYRKPNE